MHNKTRYWIAGGGIGAVLAGAAAWAMVPHRHPADLDGDGRIVAAEIEQAARRRFAEHDADRDGRLTGDEMPRRHGRHRRHHEQGDRAAPAPAAPQGQAEPAAPAAPPAANRMAPDADGDGAISFAEFRDRFAARLGRADANRDGTISAEELAAAHARRGRHRH